MARAAVLHQPEWLLLGGRVLGQELRDQRRGQVRAPERLEVAKSRHYGRLPFGKRLHRELGRPVGILPFTADDQGRRVDAREAFVLGRPTSAVTRSG